ncbi:neuropeptide-like 1 isoform X2 [Leptopilina heterotoma]|uniref:neuropeptide-like 1 isoform X2 n=1 Tax=Leptopilina heterotoma TaxID=63436 RepID=UPI001CA93BFF|nr:neuropeptide-like 1 isoform X2 [Leptopilina heterotoma]
MGLKRNYLLNLFLYISAINEIRWPTVTCQDDETPSSGCLPKKTFLALLRLPEVSSNLAAYSRTAGLIQESKNRDEMDNWKAINSEDSNSDDGEICLPAAVYLELFRNPAMRGHLSAISRALKILENPLESYQEADIKRSLAILAKNNDMPTITQEQDDDEMGNGPTDGEGGEDGINNDDDEASEFDNETLDIILKILNDNDQKNVHAVAREYSLPNGQIDFEAIERDYGQEKRNIASLARESNLPSYGKRNLASLARDYALPGGKRNFSDFLTESPVSYEKRNLASFMRSYGGKRNIASLARDFNLPPMPAGAGRKRALLRILSLPYDEIENEDKRNVASLSKNRAWPTVHKRSGRSKIPLVLSFLAKNRTGKLASGGKRPKRQIDFSDEYPLPVMQNNNVFDYEELLEALAEQYPKTEKRFMGPVVEMQDSDTRKVYDNLLQPTKRHIGALARLGWLPTLRATRFSRSPRYLVSRTNSADGTTSDDSTNTAPWALRSRLGSQTRYLQSMYEACRHFNRKFPFLSTANNSKQYKFPIKSN